MLANRWWTHLWQRRYIPIHQQDVGGVLGLTWWCSWCASRKCWWADINRPLRRNPGLPTTRTHRFCLQSFWGCWTSTWECSPTSSILAEDQLAVWNDVTTCHNHVNYVRHQGHNLQQDQKALISCCFSSHLVRCFAQRPGLTASRWSPLYKTKDVRITTGARAGRLGSVDVRSLSTNVSATATFKHGPWCHHHDWSDLPKKKKHTGSFFREVGKPIVTNL